MQGQTKRIKKYDIIQSSHTDRTHYLKSDLFSVAERSERPDKLTLLIAQKISNLHARQKNRVIQNVMHNLYGRHNPINYRSQFNFQERWQNNHKQTIFQQKYSLLKTDNYLYIILHIILYILYGFTAWFFSVYRLFMLDDCFFIFAGLVMTAKMSDAIIKQILLHQTFQNNDFKGSLKHYLKYHWLTILSLAYLVFIALQQHTMGDTKSRYLFIVDLLFVWSSYDRFKQLYSAIKFKSLSSNYRNEIQILQLFGGCILLVHIFGLFLYLVSKTDPEVNWTLKIQNFQANWESRYIYSIYFACTTALTVGFGDITPQNPFQILTIMCVQIFGIINIGFIVNEIGRILSKINERQQILYNNVSQTQKIIKNYALPEHLAAKMRTYVMNNQVANNQLHIEEEDNLINKFKDQLREKIISHNHKKAVKCCVFFICNWSKKFQNNLANKLIRCIYSPQETLPQIYGKQKIFLLTKGKLEIEACFSGKSNHLKKTLNIIHYDPNKQVQFNVYGYSSCISGFNINIRAIAKDHSICYQLSKEDLLHLIAQSVPDFQYFHEIRAKIEQSRIKQVWEAPNIANTRQNYLPNLYYIVKRNKASKRNGNNRKQYVRKSSKPKCYVQKHIDPSQNEINSQKQDNSCKSYEQASIVGSIQQPPNNKVLTQKERKEKYASIQKNQKCQYMMTNRKYRSRYPKMKVMDTYEMKLQQRDQILSNFQQVKIFKNYFCKFNSPSVFKRYNKKYSSRGENMSRTDTKLAEMLNEQLMNKLISAQILGSHIL